MMKRFILIIFLTLFSLFGFSQNRAEVIFPSNTGYDWQQVGPTCTGCASFFVGIVKSQYPNAYGNYEYKIFYQTNSYGPANDLRLTYVSDIYYFYYDASYNTWYPLDQNSYWVLCANEPYLGYTLFSPNPNLYIKIIGNYVYR